MASIHINRQQYRNLAEATKANAGMALNLSTFSKMGNCWGVYSPWVLLAHKDVTNPESEMEEISFITIASSVNKEKFRQAGAKRPELDWGKLEDNEIFPFIVWHEIGHRLDNFDAIGTVLIKDLSIRKECHRRVGFVNEILADRFAWEKVRPGEPIPLSDYGKTNRERIDSDVEYLRTHAPLNSLKIRKLESGQYKHVPDYMLATPSRAEFVGSKISQQLMESRVSYHRERMENGARALY